MARRAEKPVQKEKRRTDFNLKNIFNKVEEEKPPIEKPEKLREEAFTEKDVFSCWEQFLSELQKQNKIPVYNALHTGKIKLINETQIEFEFESASLINEFDLEKNELMKLMREKLRNDLIDFKTKLNLSETGNFVKTKADIFNEMVKKNPILLKMKEEMGLDYNSHD